MRAGEAELDRRTAGCRGMLPGDGSSVENNLTQPDKDGVQKERTGTLPEVRRVRAGAEALVVSSVGCEEPLEFHG